MKKMLKCILVTTTLILVLTSTVFAIDLDDPYKRTCVSPPNITVVK